MGLKTRDRHFHRAIWRRNKILFFSFCFCLMWNFWFKFLILPGGLAERQYTEKCRHTVRLKLNILSADQAVDENLQRNRISFKFLVNFSSTVWSFCSLYNFWQINVVWVAVGAEVYQERVPSPKVSGAKSFLQNPISRSLLFICPNIQCCFLKYSTQQNIQFSS